MRIRRVQPFLLSFPFPEPLKMPFHGGERTILKRDAMVIRVDTDNGLTGWAPGPGSERAAAVISSIVAPFLEGRALSDPDALRVQFNAGPGREPQIAHDYGAVEVALLDIVAKSLDLPLSEMVGGRVRDRIALYGSAGMYMTPDGYAAEAAAVRDMGFRAYKMRPALGPEGDIETVRKMRAATGADFELMVDAHAWWRMGDRSYSYETVERVAEAMAAERIYWLEEPLPPLDHDAYLKLREKDIVTLAAGEHEPGEAGYLDLIERGCVDYVQMDVCCQGGLSMGRRLFSAIEREGLGFAFHSWGTALEVLAAAHLGVCWPENAVEWLEYPCYSAPGRAGMYPFPLAEEILTEPLAIERGELIVPRAPGLGISVNEKMLERYPWVPGPWSLFRIDSPPQTLAVTSDHHVMWQGETR